MYSPTRLLAIFLLLAGLFALPGAARPEPAQDDLKRLQQEVERLQKLLKERDAQLAVQAAEVKQLNQRLKDTEIALKEVLRQLETLTKGLAKSTSGNAKVTSPLILKGVIAKIDPNKRDTIQIKFANDLPKVTMSPYPTSGRPA
jgi:septal ring factor EnvC (AmiA/AmiB activator)